MKKYLIIFFLFIAVILSIGNYFIYKGFEFSCKRDVRSFIKLNKKSLCAETLEVGISELYVNSKDLSWEDENKELICKGILYDVIDLRFENGKAILTVLRDEKEQAMKKQFASLYDQTSDSGSGALLKLLKQFMALKFMPTDYSPQYFHLSFTKLSERDFSSGIPEVFLAIATRPPVN